MLAGWGGARDGAVWRVALDMVATRRGEMVTSATFRRRAQFGVAQGDLLTFTEAARLLGLASSKVRDLVMGGHLTRHSVTRDGKSLFAVDLAEVSAALGSRVPGKLRSKTTDGWCSWWQQELGSVVVRFGDTAGGRLRFAAISRNQNPQIASVGPDGVRTAALCPQWTEMLVLSVWPGGEYLGRFQPASGRFFRVACDGDPLLFAEGQMRPVGLPVRGDGAAATFGRMQRWSRSGRKRSDLVYPAF